MGICERCRRLNAIELRSFAAAAELVASTDLQRLGGRVVYPFRVPLSNVDAQRLARAAKPLQEAMRELRAASRKGPKRAERAEKVKHEEGDALPAVSRRGVRRR